MGIETWIDVAQRREGTDHQSSADEQDHSHSHLDDDENVLRAMASAAGTAAAFLESFVSIGPQRFERGNQAKHNTGQDGNAQRVKEHMAIERDLLRARQAAGQSSNQNGHPQLRQNESEAAAGDAEQNALGKQLADHSRGTGSECGANRKFA